MKKLIICMLILLSVSALAQETNCKVEIVYPFGVAEIDGEEVVISIDGPIESLKVSELTNKFNKALAPLGIGVAGHGEYIDYKIELGFSGVYNKEGSVLPDFYLKVKNYDRSIEARNSSSVLNTLLKDVDERANALFDKTLKDLIPQLDKCYI